MKVSRHAIYIYFVIFSSKYSTNNDQISELDVEVSKECSKEPGSNTISSQFETLQKQGSLSPYFLAQSIVLPEARAIPNTSNNVEKRHSKTYQTTNVSSSPGTTSFCDTSLHNPHILKHVPEETIPTTFRSACLKNINQSEHEEGSSRELESINKEMKKQNYYCDNKVIVSNSFLTNTPLEERKGKTENNDVCISSGRTGHDNQQVQAELKLDDATDDSSHSKESKKSKKSLRTSNPSSPTHSLWDQKVKRMYL